jgi:hypothetical protein
MGIDYIAVTAQGSPQADGTYLGVPVSTGAATGSGDGIYSTRELGVLFTAPAGIIKVAGIHCYYTGSGSPTGNLRAKLYQGTSLVDTGDAATSRGASGTLMQLFFSSPRSLTPGAQYRAVVGETTQSDTSANRFNLQELTVHDNAASKAIMPLGGWAKTYYDGLSWTDTDTSCPAVALMLDGDAPVPASGGLMRHPGMTGGILG